MQWRQELRDNVIKPIFKQNKTQTCTLVSFIQPLSGVYIFSCKNKEMCINFTNTHKQKISKICARVHANAHAHLHLHLHTHTLPDSERQKMNAHKRHPVLSSCTCHSLLSLCSELFWYPATKDCSPKVSFQVGILVAAVIAGNHVFLPSYVAESLLVQTDAYINH